MVQLVFTDRPAKERDWWFVNQDAGCELCLSDPGFEVDLHLACTLPDMIYIVRGDLPVGRAIADERLEVIGKAKARRALPRWLNLSPLAAIESKRGEVPASA